ncbi:radical SAM protein [Candidatus Bathyarchaeota archaeon]|nr:radical SAM protein [Candidatus Bathyarchaeota archaeon]
MPRLLVPEINTIVKDWRRVDLRIALCYPNIYRVGMTGLSVQLLYALFNAHENVVCERFFLPTGGEQIVSLESGQLLKKFDVVAFTLQYEEDYVNVVRMLLESGIEPRAEQRKLEDPIVIGGGPCASGNPLPLSDFFDLFFIGEIEPVLGQLIDSLRGASRKRIADFADLPGVYLPTLPTRRAKRVWVEYLDEAPHPVAQIIPMVDEKSPYMPIFGKSFALEAVRGCGRRCRFCLIGFTGQPKRERSLKKLREIIEEGIRYTPVRKIALIGAGLSDYSRLEELCEMIISRGLEISISSLRIESITESLANLLVKGGQRTLTFAPEAGTPRLREAIGKRVSDEAIIDAARIALQTGFRNIKLYFMIGLPGETLGDVEAIVELTRRIADQGFGLRSVRISVNPFVPKPHTPFQWEPYAGVEYLRECMKLIRRRLASDRRIEIEGVDPRNAQIQALLSLGDRKVGRAIEIVARLGNSLGAWRRAIATTKLNLESYIYQRKSLEARLPLDVIDI